MNHHNPIVGLLGLPCLLCSSLAFASPPPKANATQWRSLPKMTFPRSSHAAIHYPDVGVVVAGGAASGVPDPTLVEALDLDTETWRTLSPLPANQRWPVATELLDGRWLLFSRIDSAIYDPIEDLWHAEPALTWTVRSDAALATLADGDVLIIGGYEDHWIPDTSLRYDPWAQTIVGEAKLHYGRASSTATTLPSGDVLVAGGWSWVWGWSEDGEHHWGKATTTDLVDMYDADADSWRPVAPMHAPRDHHTAALLPSGQVLVVGGIMKGIGDGAKIVGTAELYDPITDTWTVAAPLLQARARHTMTVLPSGRVIVTGGIDLMGALDSVEAYDPTTDNWIALPPMAEPRGYHTATYVPDHGLLVIGGLNDDLLGTVELLPLGQSVPGTPCAIPDECQSGVCTPVGVCAGPQRRAALDSTQRNALALPHARMLTNTA
jgi:hypothetical protein